ncbi:MAG: hypothetical protein ABIH55_01810 [Nanoarchaeota archaeon]
MIKSTGARKRKSKLYRATYSYIGCPRCGKKTRSVIQCPKCSVWTKEEIEKVKEKDCL